MVVNDYALIGGWVNSITENVVPNACWVDEDVFYTRLDGSCSEVASDDAIGFLNVIESIVREWRILGDVLGTRKWYFWLGFGSGIR